MELLQQINPSCKVTSPSHFLCQSLRFTLQMAPARNPGFPTIWPLPALPKHLSYQDPLTSLPGLYHKTPLLSSLSLCAQCSLALSSSPIHPNPISSQNHQVPSTTPVKTIYIQYHSFHLFHLLELFHSAF